jgi:dGTPase
MPDKTIREELEAIEHETLSKYATFSDESKGRRIFENQCDIRPVFQRDRDRILHCKSFRRLKGKTQVFLAPEGDHYRTRLTHTLEVSQNARTIAKALRLNEELAEAIALGHDLGHTPFGHAGERALNRVVPGGFKHNEQSLRVVDVTEKDGKGLNLTYEVRDGIINHEINLTPSTPEGRIVRISDKVAYTVADIDDAIRAKILSEDDLPKELTDILGHTMQTRLNTLIHDIIRNSRNTAIIDMSDGIKEVFFALRSFMFENVYTNSEAKAEEGKAERLVELLYGYYVMHPEKLPDEYVNMLREGRESNERIACDYVAGMTDNYAVQIFNEIMIPKSWDLL